ncbi:MAG: hypothetical protein JRH16_12815 [Deltaproteobacteria bacterium]|nr:hypothetical protein [Deltaproteobacteria bacterium]MBW2361002.1 hypothetical protein [Deltaproteobacteria bacterium]
MARHLDSRRASDGLRAREIRAQTPSYRADLRADGLPTYPFAVVTTARVRPGHTEACEELIRKIAEAIPKLDDPARISTFQSIVGDLHTYWVVRPLHELSNTGMH